jgi:hypothetical protein
MSQSIAAAKLHQLIKVAAYITASEIVAAYILAAYILAAYILAAYMLVTSKSTNNIEQCLIPYFASQKRSWTR